MVWGGFSIKLKNPILFSCCLLRRGSTYISAENISVYAGVCLGVINGVCLGVIDGVCLGVINGVS